MRPTEPQRGGRGRVFLAAVGPISDGCDLRRGEVCRHTLIAAITISSTASIIDAPDPEPTLPESRSFVSSPLFCGPPASRSGEISFFFFSTLTIVSTL